MWFFFSLGLRLGICIAWRRWCDDWWVGLFVMFVSRLAKPRLLNGFVRSFIVLCSSLFHVAILFAFLVYVGILAILIVGRLFMK